MTKIIAVSLVALLSVGIIAAIVKNAEALQTPPGQSIWERHALNPTKIHGTRSTLTKTTPSLVTGTDWWWARTFVWEGVMSYNSDYGAFGAGWARYIPLGGTTATYKEMKYVYNRMAASQSWYFSPSGPSTSVQYQVYYSALTPGCWNLYTSSDGWTQQCIGPMTWGHSRFTVMSSHTGNSVPGIFDNSEFKDNISPYWHSYSTYPDSDIYCEMSPADNLPAYKVQILDAGKSLRFGSSASSNSCKDPGSLGYWEAIELPG